DVDLVLELDLALHIAFDRGLESVVVLTGFAVRSRFAAFAVVCFAFAVARFAAFACVCFFLASFAFASVTFIVASFAFATFAVARRAVFACAAFTVIFFLFASFACALMFRCGRVLGFPFFVHFGRGGVGGIGDAAVGAVELHLDDRGMAD